MSNYSRMAGRRHMKGKPFKLFSDQLPTVDFNKLYLDEQYGKHTYEIQHMSNNTRTTRRVTDTDNYSLPSPRRPDWDDLSVSEYSRAKSESPAHPLSPNLAHLRRNIRNRFGVVGKQIHDSSDPMSPHYFERLSEKRNGLIGVAPFAASPRAMELVSGVKPTGGSTQSYNKLRRITTPKLSATSESKSGNDDSSQKSNSRPHDSLQANKDDAISILRNQMRLGVRTHLKAKAKKEAKQEAKAGGSQNDNSWTDVECRVPEMLSEVKDESVKVEYTKSESKTRTEADLNKRSHNLKKRQSKICTVEPLNVDIDHTHIEHSDDVTTCKSEERVQTDLQSDSIISNRGILKTPAANAYTDKTNKHSVGNMDEQSHTATQNVEQTDVHITVHVVTPLSQLNKSLHDYVPSINAKEDMKRRRVNFNENNTIAKSNTGQETAAANDVKQDIRIPAKLTVTEEKHENESDVKENNKEETRRKGKKPNKLKFQQHKTYLPRLAVLPAIQRENERDTDSQLGNQWQPVKPPVAEPHLLSPESIPVDYVINCANTRRFSTPVSEFGNSRCSNRRYAAQTPALDHSDFNASNDKSVTSFANEVPEMDYIAKVIDVFEEFEKNKEEGDDEIDRSMTGEELLKAYRLWDRKRRVFPTGYRNIEPPEKRDGAKAAKQFGYATPYKINNDTLESKELNNPNTVTL